MRDLDLAARLSVGVQLELAVLGLLNLLQRLLVRETDGLEEARCDEAASGEHGTNNREDVLCPSTA